MAHFTIPTPAEFKKIQEENQPELNAFVVMKCKENLENGKFCFSIKYPDNLKGNKDVARSYLAEKVIESGWDKDTIEISHDESAIELMLYDENAGNIHCLDGEDDDYINDDSYEDDGSDDDSYEEEEDEDEDEEEDDDEEEDEDEEDEDEDEDEEDEDDVEIVKVGKKTK
jgi:cobalamin biosynthesis protein CobT